MTLIPKKSSKSNLIGVWHKDNSYLDTSTIRNEPSSNKYWFANEKYKDDAMKSVVISPPHKKKFMKKKTSLLFKNLTLSHMIRKL
jgi:hypothetical protein